jgi:hypothetical protein
MRISNMAMRITRGVLGCLTVASVFPGPGTAQERSRIVLIEMFAASPADTGVVTPLARALEQQLGRMAGTIVPSIQVVRDTRIKAGNDSARVPADRAQIAVSRVEGVLLRAKVTVMPLTGEPFDFEVTQVQVNDLADQLAGQLVFRLTRRIRIGMLSFPMRRGNVDKYGNLDKSLPAMIGEGLTVSPRITLVESLSEEQLEQLKESIPQAAGLHDQRTALTLGRRLHANYLLMGEYWELNDAVRVDVRCVNVETGVVVVTRGINITNVSVDRIHREMSSLAATLRAIIENDFTPHARPRNVAVSARSPYPDNRENRRILEELVRTVARKMRVTRHDSLRVHVPTPERLREYLDQRVDGLLVSAELEADYLFTLSLNRFDRDELEIELDVFDALNPAERRFHRQVTASVVQVNQHLEALADSALASIGIQLSAAQRAAWREPGYRGLYQPLGFQVQIGPSLRADEGLFLGVGGGIALEFGFTWTPFDSGRWQVQPMGLRFDFLGKRSQRVVVGADLLFATLNYRHRPHMTLNPYVGASFGYLGVFRGGTGDKSYDARLGFGLAAGLEHTFENARRFTYQIRWLRAVDNVASQRLGQSTFPYGRPGGLYLSIGTALF